MTLPIAPRLPGRRKRPKFDYKFVWFEGRCWRLDEWQGKDHRGHVSLTSLRDDSCGTLAPPEKCLPVSDEEHDAILYFLYRDGKGGS